MTWGLITVKIKVMMRTGFILLMVGVMGLLLGCKSDQPPSKPNIIYILADDLGYGELGCYGQEKIETPHIDALAEKGMMFTQYYSASPVCAPARCMLLTGLHAGNAYIRSNDGMPERGDTRDFLKVFGNPDLEGQRPMPANTVTVAELLQGAGYKTGIVGKWGLGYPTSESVPNKMGFDFFYGYNCQGQAHTYFPLHLWSNEEKVLLDNDTVPPRTKLAENADPYDISAYSDYWLNDYTPALMQEKLIGFIKDHKDQPFFMYYANPIPHAPLQAPPRWVEYYVEKFGDEAPYLGDQGYFPQRYPHATYAAMVSYFDEQVGEIVETLKQEGLYDNTLIIFTSDNGPTYNGGTDSPWFDSGGPFRSDRGWGKGYLKEGGIRVPMIAHWPGQIEPGSTTGHLSVHYDVLATLCDLAGIDPPVRTDGISFLPTLLGQSDQEEHDFLYWEFPSYGGQQAVRMGEWKGLRMNIFDGNQHIELYNLSEDAGETKDVAEQYPEIVQKMEIVFDQEHTPSEVEKFRMAQLGD